jgi:hypothetical protein
MMDEQWKRYSDNLLWLDKTIHAQEGILQSLEKLRDECVTRMEEITQEELAKEAK